MCGDCPNFLKKNGTVPFRLQSTEKSSFDSERIMEDMAGAVIEIVGEIVLDGIGELLRPGDPNNPPQEPKAG